MLIRIVVGGIFVSEGIQKFLFPAERGPGRFAIETPLSAPEFFGYLTGGVEIACGAFLLIGFLTRVAAVPLIVDMVGAEIVTKVPVLVQDGVWMYLHEARNELSQLFGALFLLLVGAGTYSLDARLATASPRQTQSPIPHAGNPPAVSTTRSRHDQKASAPCLPLLTIRPRTWRAGWGPLMR